MSIKEAIGRLKVVDSDKPQPSSGPKLLLTQEQWAAGQGDKKGEPSSAAPSRKSGKRGKSRKGTQGGAQGRADGGARGGAQGAAAEKPKPAQDDCCNNYGRAGHWAKDCR